MEQSPRRSLDLWCFILSGFRYPNALSPRGSSQLGGIALLLGDEGGPMGRIRSPCQDGEQILSLQPHPSTILPAGRCHFVLCKGSALLVKHPMGSALLLAAGEQLSTVMLG